MRYQSVDDTLHLTVKSQNLTYIVILTPSGVSRVGVTWGGNWWVSPFFLEKNLRTFLASESDWPFLAVISSPLPSSYVVYPVFFINSATKNHFRSGVTLPGWCHPGLSASRPLVTPLNITRGNLHDADKRAYLCSSDHSLCWRASQTAKRLRR